MTSKWMRRFMQLAYTISKWSSCIRNGRQVGSVIVKDKRILSTGYNGAPSGTQSCRDIGLCIRDEMGIESGTHHEICKAVHAEQNAIIQAAKFGIPITGSTLFCTHQPCSICMKMIINAGISSVVYDQGYPDDATINLASDAHIHLINLNELDDSRSSLNNAYTEFLENIKVHNRTLS